MKHFIKFVLLSAVATLLATASTASATSVTTVTGGAASTPLIQAINEGGHITLANAIANISCGVALQGWIESHGSGQSASGHLSSGGGESGCTNSWSESVISFGSFSISYTSGHNGTVSSSGGKIKTTRLGVSCVYETNNTKIGTVTGGSPATLHIEASIPISFESSGLCGAGNAKLEGNLVSNSPLYVSS